MDQLSMFPGISDAGGGYQRVPTSRELNRKGSDATRLSGHARDVKVWEMA